MAKPALRTLFRHIPTLIGLALLGGAIYVVQREFRHLRWEEIKAALFSIPPAALAFAFGWTVLSYWILTFYDRLGTIYAGHKLSYARAAYGSFLAYTLSHNIGMAAVSGGAVRYRMYSQWGMSGVEIAKTIAFCSVTFAMGGLTLGSAVLLWLPAETVPFFGPHLHAWAIKALGVALGAVVVGYITLARVLPPFSIAGHPVALPGFKFALMQVALATVDVAVTATIFYALLPAGTRLDWVVFLAVYLVAYTGGLAANLPGGIGVFDTAMLIGLRGRVDEPHIVGAIVVFRLFYYLIPLFIAGVAFSGGEIAGRLADVGRAIRRR